MILIVEKDFGAIPQLLTKSKNRLETFEKKDLKLILIFIE